MSEASASCTTISTGALVVAATRRCTAAKPASENVRSCTPTGRLATTKRPAPIGDGLAHEPARRLAQRDGDARDGALLFVADGTGNRRRRLGSSQSAKAQQQRRRQHEPRG